MFIIIYARVIDGKKKDGLKFEGPYYGSELPTMQQAHEKAKDLVSSDKNLVLIRIYDLDEMNHKTAFETAKNCFSSIFENMEASASIIDRPSIKIKKRRRKLKKKKETKKV